VSGAIIAFVVAGLFAIGDWIAVARSNQRLEYVAKPATVAALIGAALLVEPTDGAMRVWFVSALVLALAGDVFLMLPRDLFIAGLGAFFLAHLLYIGGLIALGVDAGNVAATAVPLGVSAVLLGRRVVSGVVQTDPALAVPVISYIAAISTMVALAVGSGRVEAAGGATLFYVSDLLIAWDRFVQPLSWAPVVIIVTYHLAQGGLVASLAR
jgi:uncharacterized membrane protein YhhN